MLKNYFYHTWFVGNFLLMDLKHHDLKFNGMLLEEFDESNTVEQWVKLLNASKIHQVH